MAIAPLTFSDLGDDVGIDQVIHSSTSRPKSRLRPRSMPSRGAETSSALRPVALLAPKCSRNNERVSDSRLGSDSAVTTPRTRGASSLRTWTSRRTTPRRFRRCRNSDRDFFFRGISMMVSRPNYRKCIRKLWQGQVLDLAANPKAKLPVHSHLHPCDLIRSAPVVFIDEN